MFLTIKKDLEKNNRGEDEPKVLKKNKTSKQEWDSIRVGHHRDREEIS